MRLDFFKESFIAISLFFSYDKAGRIFAHPVHLPGLDGIRPNRVIAREQTKNSAQEIPINEHSATSVWCFAVI